MDAQLAYAPETALPALALALGGNVDHLNSRKGEKERACFCQLAHRIAAGRFFSSEEEEIMITSIREVSLQLEEMEKYGWIHGYEEASNRQHRARWHHHPVCEKQTFECPLRFEVRVQVELGGHPVVWTMDALPGM